jgi:hypothetical protein
MRIILSVFVLWVFAFGCATVPANLRRYDVNVDSIAGKNQIPNKHYILAPGMETARIMDLEYFEYADYVHRALSKKGYVRAEGIHDANIVIFLAYGISDSYAPPEIVLVPGWNSVDLLQPSSDESRQADDPVTSRRPSLSDMPQDEIGIGGVLAGNLSSAVSTRVIILDAFNLNAYREKRKEVRVWRMKVSSTGRTADLRQLFPIMLAGALDHIGEDTRGKIEQWIYEDDPNLLYMMGR